MKKTLFITLAIVAFAGQAAASNPEDSGVAAFIGYSQIDVTDSGVTLKPTGYDLGIRATLGSKIGAFGHIDYTTFSGDDTISGVKINADFDEIRGSVGYAVPVAANAKAYVEAGYESLKSKFSSNGISDSETDKGPYFGIGGSADITPAAGLYGRLGYLSLKPKTGNNISGPDGLIGLSFKATAAAAFFGEFRYASLSQDSTDIKFSSLRAGVKLSFQ